MTCDTAERREEPFEARLRSPSQVAARDPAHLGAPARHARRHRVKPDSSRTPWTDDHSNIIEAMRDRRAP